MLSTIGSIASQNQLPVWDKYNVVITHHYTWTDGLNHNGYSSFESAPSGGRAQYSFSESLGFQVYGNLVNKPSDFYITLYDNTRLQFYQNNNSSGSTFYKVYLGNAVDNPTSSKGTLVQSDIRAVAGTYPNDGVHTDGYWYTKRV